MRTMMLVLLVSSTASASALEEVNLWRSKNGLPAFEEDKKLTAAAQHKAEYRAARLLKDGHQGPSCPAGCREGTGEARPEWGWLTCVMEESGTHAGAGVAIGADGQRYMVLIVRGTRGSAPKGRAVRPIRTAHLTPDAPRISRRR
jgi:hypothetical protein